MSPVRAVIFDMDGLMLDTEQHNTRAWLLSADEFGFAFPDGFIRSMAGRTLRDIHRMVAAILPAGTDFARVWERTDGHYNRMLREEPIPLKPGLLPLLDTLEGRGVPKAVATSSRAAQAAHKLNKTGLAHRFAHVVAGDQIERGKPAPDVFLATAAAMAIPPRDCLVLEDSLPGVEGALAADMRVIWVPEHLPCPAAPPGVHAIADDLFQVARELAALL